MRRLAAFLRERAALAGTQPAVVEGGASFAYVFGKVLVFLLLLEAATGAALAAFYSPSTTDAWASVAYIQDQSTWGWLVRGLHHHGGGALVVVAGLHLVQTAVAGAYKRPRELVWWLGVVLLVLTLAWAVTGFVLRWDQEGYWANRVELGIAAGTPLIGDKIRNLALGGNDYGNLTLTRFYALHVALLPGVVLALTGFHVWLARKHGATPVGKGTAVPRWPDQSVRDAFAMALTLSILLAAVINSHGEGLAAPADPSAAYDARPLWYFRWLFELRTLTGSAEGIAAIVAPAIVGGYLVMLPLLDKSPERTAGARRGWLGGLAGLFALVGALTVMSFVRDGDDPELAKRREEAVKLADRARTLARTNGVPATGAHDVFATPPMWKARSIFAKKCSGCHDAASKDREGPIIGPGHGNRAWLKEFLLKPNDAAFYGKTKLVQNSMLAKKKEAEELAKKAAAGKTPDKDKDKPDDKGDKPKPEGPQDLAMPAVELTGSDLDDLVEMLYAQSGATDADAAKVARGVKAFEACDNCHTMTEGVASQQGPNLFGLDSRDYYTSFIGNPLKQIHMQSKDMSQMPAFDHELTLVERDAIAQYLVWLRTATKADVDALGPL